MLRTSLKQQIIKYLILFSLNELSQLYKCKTKIIPYVITWDGVVTSYHKKYLKEFGVPNNVEAYIQSRVLKKTLESVSFDHRRGIGYNGEEEDAVSEVGQRISESTLLSV